MAAPFAMEAPQWDTKPRYIPGVLIGNWYEEREKYTKNRQPHNSSYRVDYNPYDGARPDVFVRRQGVFLNEGIGKDNLYGHHGNRYSNNLITWYDQDYNKRPRKEGDYIPDKRDWKIGTHMAWVPEKTDYPIFGEPTNWGLTQEKKAEWDKNRSSSSVSVGATDYTTTTKYYYGKSPEMTRVDRFYIGRSLDKQKSTVLPVGSSA